MFVDISGERDQRNPEQELGIQIIHEDKEAEVKAEERLNVFLEVDEVSNLRLEDEDLLGEAKRDTKRKKDAVALGQIKRQTEDEIRPERSLHLPSASRRAHGPERFYSEDWNEFQQEGEEWQLADEWQRILEMVFCSRDIEINPMGGGCISNSVLNTKGVDVVNIRTPPHETFICVSQTLILRLDGRRGLVRDCNDSILSFEQ